MKGCNDISFSNKDREERLQLVLTSCPYDLIIIGGGITGAGIALDASLRGIKTLLIEKGDFASGTSSKSTKLIHGGLRYLKQFEFGLVSESGLERAVAHHNIPHLVHPEHMLLPIVENGGFGKFTASLAVSVYDFLAKVEKEDRRKILNMQKAIEIEPLLPVTRLIGAIVYSEYRTDDARLTLEIIKAARRNGAEAFNYLEFESFGSEGSEVSEGLCLNCRDHVTGERISFEARAVVSAAGPWVDKVRATSGSVKGKKLHLTKGVHIVVDHARLPVRSSIYFDTRDDRMIFVIPRGNVCYIGTTDTDYDDDLDNVVCSEEEARYLINNVNNYFEGINIELPHVISSWAGLRPLIHEEGKDPSELSRKDEVFISPNGMLSIAGGKLTGYRKMAERVIDLLQEKEMLESKALGQTRNFAIHSDTFLNYKEYEDYKKQFYQKYLLKGIKKELVDYLVDNYGKHTEYIMSSIDQSNDDFDEAILRSEISYTLEFEAACRPDDFFNRRSGLLYFNPKRIEKYSDAIIDTFSAYFYWTSEYKEEQRRNMTQIINTSTRFT